MSHKKEQAISLFGREKVAEVEALIFMSDPDLVHSILQDQEDEDGASIVEILHFDND